MCERLRTMATALDRKRNPGDTAHIYFLRMAAGLPTFSHKGTVLAEYGRRPLLTNQAWFVGSRWRLEFGSACGACSPAG